MSRDIRSFFQQKKVSKPKVEDDDDVIPESPDVQIKNKKKVHRKKRVLSDESDDDSFASKKKKSNHESHKKSHNKAKSPLKPALKEVKVVDLFGSAPVKRTEAIVKKIKKVTEIGIHSDEEFDKSLLELDQIEEIETKPKEEIPPIKTNVNNTQTSVKIKEEVKKEKSTDKLIASVSPKNADKNLELKVQHTNGKGKVLSKMEKNKSKFTEFIEDHEKQNGGVEQEDKTKKNSYEKLNKSETNININESVKKKDKKRRSSGLNESYDNLEITRNLSDAVNNSDISFTDINDSVSMKKKKRGSVKHNDSDTTLNESTSKKKKVNRSLNESVLTDEERFERKMQSAALYQKYLHRSGPKHLGSKQIPEGSPDCLKDCAFLLTGVLDSFEREEVTEAIKQFGGTIKNGVSRKITHVLAGEDAGPAKLAKAQELGIKIINEDEFLQMIVDLSSNKKPRNGLTQKIEVKKKKVKADTSLTKADLVDHAENMKKIDGMYLNVPQDVPLKIEDSTEDIGDKKIDSNSDAPNSLMWVEKYKPRSLKQIIGQHGEASNVKKLSNWLTKWYVNRKAKIPKPSPWAKNDDGAYYKAALLSGPPGVGKTTTVALVCKELGFDAVEFNASDTRSKSLIKEQIGELLTTNSLSAYAKGDTSKQAVTKKHVLVMDEVDGMAGNEDRGGLQELISLIKSTSVPIICMCNDRNSQKMRSLVNYCYDLRFNRPRVDQIKSAMMSICFKEGVKIPADVLTQLVVAAHSDVRQTLNLLSLWAAEPALADAERLRKDVRNIKKDVKLGPWEAIRKVFTREEHKNMSINEKSDLFFYDYSLAPLFVQENYLQVTPHCPKHEILLRISKAADSISIGDMVDARIRGSQAWSLLPLQAMYSSVIPGHEMSGHVAGQIQFPGWLGKNSRANKMQRLCQEIHSHTRLSTSGSKLSVFLDYCTHLRDAIVNPLIKDKADGISKSMEVLESYHLLREDLESLVELSLWPKQRNPMVLIDSKVKASMTRTYNKTATALPYAPGAIRKARRDDGEEDEEAEEDNDSDPENDALIKKSKSKESAKSVSKTTEKAGSSKEKGKKNKK